MTIEQIKNTIWNNNQTTNDYKFLDKNEHLKDNIILLGLGGSHAYGTSTPTSDLDVRGIAVRTKSDILLGKDFEQVVNEHTDTTIYSLDKVFHLLYNCNPNVIELLGLKPEHYLLMTDVGKTIKDNKQIFLSKRCIHTFGGYANQQMYRLQQKSLSAMPKKEYNEHTAKVIKHMLKHFEERYGIKDDQINAYTDDNDELRLSFNFKDFDAREISGLIGELNSTIQDYYKPSKRNKKALEHGKIAKHAMHLLRLYMMAIDILEKQEIITYRQDEHDLLMSIRNGEWLDSDGRPNKDFFDLVKEYEAKFNKAKETTTLPDEPDLKTIEKLRYKINESIIKGE